VHRPAQTPPIIAARARRADLASISSIRRPAVTDNQPAPQQAPQTQQRQPEPPSGGTFADHPNPLIRIALTLIRAVLMLIYALLFEVMNYVIFSIAIVQLVAIAATARPIKALDSLNEGLSSFMGDITGYLTCVDDAPPFPFSRPRGRRSRPRPVGWKRQDG
jgi:hypothetical protein